jgi:serine/threonine protein kinase
MFSYGLLVWNLLLNGDNPFNSPKSKSWRLSRVGSGKDERQLILDFKYSPEFLKFALDDAFLMFAEPIAPKIRQLFKKTLKADPKERAQNMREVLRHFEREGNEADEKLRLRYVSPSKSDTDFPCGQSLEPTLTSKSNLIMMLVYQKAFPFR